MFGENRWNRCGVSIMNQLEAFQQNQCQSIVLKNQLPLSLQYFSMNKAISITILVFIVLALGEAAVMFQGKGNTLFEEQYLLPGQRLRSHDGYSARMQDDGNFVIYDDRSGIAVWSTGTFGTTGHRLVMQDDGNLVLYDQDRKPIWATMSTIGRGQSPYRLVMQQDRNLVMYDANNSPLWATGTQV